MVIKPYKSNVQCRHSVMGGLVSQTPEEKLTSGEQSSHWEGNFVFLYGQVLLGGWYCLGWCSLPVKSASTILWLTQLDRLKCLASRPHFSHEQILLRPARKLSKPCQCGPLQQPLQHAKICTGNMLTVVRGGRGGGEVMHVQ